MGVTSPADAKKTNLPQLRRAWLTVVVLTLSTPILAAQPSERTVVRSVQIAVRDGLTTAIIEADGPLPPPISGAVDSPPRIYLDLTGVTPQLAGITQLPGGGAISGVRIALFANRPNVTRVVFDLAQSGTFRLNTDDLSSGRLGVLIGAESSPARIEPAAPGPTVLPPGATPPASLTPSAAAPTPAPAITAPTVAGPPPQIASVIGAGVPAPAPPNPARRNLPRVMGTPDLRLPPSEVEQYRRQLQGALERIEARRPVIEAIDTAVTVSIDVLEFTAVEFSDLRRILGAIQPSESLRTTHDLLTVSCTLGARAVGLQIQASRHNDAEARRNAPSAAAGSLMLLDRACARLACADPRR